MSDEFRTKAESIVLANNQADLHARLAAIEFHLEHGEYPLEFQLDTWSREFAEEHERAVDGLTPVLRADHEFKVIADTFSQDEYDDEGIGIDEYCELCHDSPDGCDACQDA